MPPKRGGSGVFAGLSFCLSGPFSVDQDVLQSLITAHGGRITPIVTADMHYLLSATVYTGKYKQAVKLAKPVVKEAWLRQSVDKSALSTDAAMFHSQPAVTTAATHGRQQNSDMREDERKEGEVEAAGEDGREVEDDEEEKEGDDKAVEQGDDNDEEEAEAAADDEANGDDEVDAELEDAEDEKPFDEEEEEHESEDEEDQQRKTDLAKLQSLTPTELKALISAEGLQGVREDDSAGAVITALIRHRHQQPILAQPTPSIDPALDASLWDGPAACVQEQGYELRRPLPPFDVWLTRGGGRAGAEFCRLQISSSHFSDSSSCKGQPYELMHRWGRSGQRGRRANESLLGKKATIRRFTATFHRLTGQQWDAYQQAVADGTHAADGHGEGGGGGGGWRVMSSAQRETEVAAQVALARRLFWVDPHCTQQLPDAFNSGHDASVLLAKRDGNKLQLTWLQRVQTVAKRFVWQRDLTVDMSELAGEHSDAAVWAQVETGPKGDTTLHAPLSYRADAPLVAVMVDKTGALSQYDEPSRHCYARVAGKHSIHPWADHVLRAEKQAEFSADDMQAAIEGKYHVPVLDETEHDHDWSPFRRLALDVQKAGFDRLIADTQASILESMQAQASSAVDKQLVSAMSPYLQPAHYRGCYLPVLTRTQAAIIGGESVPASTRVSKYGGRPYLQPGEEWPTCSYCKKKMTFWCQLRTSDLPAELRASYAPSELSSSALFQHFACDNWDGCQIGREEVYCTSYTVSEEPKGRAGKSAAAPPPAKKHKQPRLQYNKPDDTIFLRWIQPEGEEDPAERLKPDEGDKTGSGERVLTAWRRVTEYPDSMEYDELGVDVADPDAAVELWPNVRQDKLSGYASWEQDMDMGECQQCGAAMTFLMQYEGNRHRCNVATHGNGVVTLSTCVQHPNVLRYVYNCT